MRAGRVLRQMIIARIEDQVAELGGRVYDKATTAADYPYATMGPSDWRDDSADCIKARVQSVQIDVWHSGSNKGAVEDLVDDIAAALDGYEDEAVLTMHPLTVTLIRVFDDPSGDVHGVVQVEAMLERS